MVSLAADDVEMQKVFAHIDVDSDGRISPSKLAVVSRAIFYPSSSSHRHREVATMMDELDIDRDLLHPKLPLPSTELATPCTALALTEPPLQP